MSMNNEDPLTEEEKKELDDILEEANTQIEIDFSIPTMQCEELDMKALGYNDEDCDEDCDGDVEGGTELPSTE